VQGEQQRHGGCRDQRERELADRRPGRGDVDQLESGEGAEGQGHDQIGHAERADYLVENDGGQWSLTTGAPPARVDVTITATTQALTALIFAGSDTGIDITGETGPVQRFRQLIGTMATVVQPA
jgi:hypothetical protein